MHPDVNADTHEGLSVSHTSGVAGGESPRVRDQGWRWPMVRTSRVQLACEGPADVSSAPTSSRPHPGLWSPGSLPGNLTQDTWFLSFLHCQVALGPCPEWGGRLTVTCVSLFAGCSVYSAGEHGTGLTGRARCPLWPLGSWSLPDKAGGHWAWVMAWLPVSCARHITGLTSALGARRARGGSRLAGMGTQAPG